MIQPSLSDQVTMSMSMSAAGRGRPSRSASRIVARPADGFHLLRIDGYSQTKTILPGHKLSSQQFYVGGHSWRIDYYPNGRDESNSDAISVYLQLTDPTQSPQQARYKFSLLDQAGIPAYELPAETGSFTGVFPNVRAHYNLTIDAGDDEEESGPGCGHDELIGKEELERRRGDLIRDDCIVIRCDVGVTQIDLSCLAQDEIIGDGDHVHYPPPLYSGYGPPRRRQRQQRADDDEYVKWCVTQKPGGSLRGSPDPDGGDYYE